MTTCSKNGISKAKVFSVALDKCEPVTIEAAFACPEWTKVVQVEYEALMKNDAWELVSLPTDK